MKRSTVSLLSFSILLLFASCLTGNQEVEKTKEQKKMSLLMSENGCSTKSTARASLKKLAVQDIGPLVLYDSRAGTEQEALFSRMVHLKKYSGSKLLNALMRSECPHAFNVTTNPLSADNEYYCRY